MPQNYPYVISTAFPNGTVAPDVLTDQINDSSISSSTLDYINVRITGPDTCDIWFDAALSGADQTTLDGLVAAHDGVPYLDIQAGEPGWNLRVEDRNLTTPPVSPKVGEYWIVGAGSTGAWAGWDDSVGGWNGTTWQFQRPSEGLAAWVFDEDIVVVYVDATTKWASYGTPSGVGGVFGTEVHQAESLSVSTTTSASPQNKVSMVTATLTGGLYRLEVHYGWNTDAATSDFFAQVQQDGVTLGEPHQQEPKDTAGSWGSTGTNQRHYLTRVFYRTLSAQSYTFTLDYNAEFGGTVASIWDASMTLWRMS